MTTEYIGIKQFKVYHSYMVDFEAIIQIDFDYPEIFEIMKQAYLFYHDLYDVNDRKEILESFLRHIAGGIWSISAAGEYNTYGVRSHVTKDLEGYPHLDGSTGIWLMHHEHPEVEDSDFEIIEVSGYQYFTPKDI